MAKQDEIKTMKLYHHVDRIERRLHELGYTNKETLVDPEQLGTLDSLHFFGDEPICHIVELLAAVPGETKVLDIGTGFGGTARLLAHRSGCKVDALELQPDLSKAGEELTRRCGLSHQVRHCSGDFLERPVQHNEYDVVVGLLCFLHIGHWQQLFTRCFDSLKPGGVLYVDDFFLRGDELTEEDQRTLKQDIYCAELLQKEQLTALLTTCGFATPEFEDTTTKWRPYVMDRAQQYHATLDTHIARDGEAAARSLDQFYTCVGQLFRAGNVGGYTLVVRKPL